MVNWAVVLPIFLTQVRQKLVGPYGGLVQRR